MVEIGPGMGVLTERLLATGAHVIALELDDELARRLRTQEWASERLTVVHGDGLEADAAALLSAGGFTPETPYGLAGNLPYNVGTAIVRRFLESSHPPASLVVMLQREVAESMTGKDGDLGLLGVSVQVYARARKLFNVPPRAFYPPPRVTSSVVRLDVRESPLLRPEEREAFFHVLRAGFSSPRKTLRNTLSQGLGLPAPEVSAAIEAAGLSPDLRPQQAGVEAWVRLARHLETSG